MSSTVLMKWDWPRIRLPPSGISSGIVFSSMKDFVYRNYLNILRQQMERPFLHNLVDFGDFSRLGRVVSDRRRIVGSQLPLQLLRIAGDRYDHHAAGTQTRTDDAVHVFH